MKKYILIILIASATSSLFAQTTYDALQMSQLGLKGTARYMGLAGAFGSLGADASALKDNPAGLGVYRSSEAGLTTDLSINSMSPVDWYNNRNYQESNTNFLFNNFSYVIASPSGKSDGLLSSNFSITYNRLHNYDKKFAISGNNAAYSFLDYLSAYSANKYRGGDHGQNITLDNTDIPWLTVLGYEGYLLNYDSASNKITNILLDGETVEPSYKISQTGSLSEFSFGWGGNYNNRLFVGANINFRFLKYDLSSVYGEDFHNGGNFDIQNIFSQSGFGANLKLGVIYLPTDNLRLGFSFHTPTYMSVNETFYANMSSNGIKVSDTNPNEYDKVVYDVGKDQSYDLWSPLQMQASASYLFGTKGLISLEYDYINYKGASFMTNAYSTQSTYAYVNQDMGTALNDVNNLKIGAEYKVTPSIALRAGYMLTTPLVNPSYTDGKTLAEASINTNTEFANQIYNTNYYTCGLGYRSEGWFADLAYVQKQHKEDFYPHNFSDKAVVNTVTNDIVLTVGFKF